MIVTKEKINRATDRVCDTISLTTSNVQVKKLLAYISLIVISFSSRHAIYCWYIWLKVSDMGWIKFIVIIFFATNRSIIVDCYIYLSALIHIFDSRQVYYEITGNLNRTEELREFFNKISFKNIYENRAISNSVPTFTDSIKNK